MKAAYGLPSGSYMIQLQKEDIKALLDTGSITVNPFKHVPCTTSRAVFNEHIWYWTTM